MKPEDHPDFGDILQSEFDEAAPHFPRTAISDFIERIVIAIGIAFSFLWVVLMLAIVWQVVARYGFGIGSIMLEELQWHIFGAAFIVGLSFAIVDNRHVRVDVLSEHYGATARAWIELVGLLFLLIPFAVIIFYDSIPFVERAIELNEKSSNPGGLPYRWIIKAFIPFGFLLIALAAFARLMRVTCFLFGWPENKGPWQPTHHS